MPILKTNKTYTSYQTLPSIERTQVLFPQTNPPYTNVTHFKQTTQNALKFKQTFPKNTTSVEPINLENHWYS